MFSYLPHNLIVAGAEGCTTAHQHRAVIHACKHPCHKQQVGVVHPEHPHYLSLTYGHDLYLNMIDPPTPLFQVALFITALNFIAQHHAQQRQVLIHCNQGRSRAPTLGLLYLAQTNLLPQDSYAVAAAAFRLTYMRDYQPGQGIQTFLTQNWNQLLQTTIQQV